MNKQRFDFAHREAIRARNGWIWHQIHSTADIDATARIGATGQGLEWDAYRQQWLELPQMAGVIIGPHVRIGPHCTIMRGAWRDTEIGEGCQIGNGVNIGHGARLGKHCLICAHATLAGSVQLGDRVVVWMGAMVGHGLQIGADSVIGMGARITQDVKPGMVVK